MKNTVETLILNLKNVNSKLDSLTTSDSAYDIEKYNNRKESILCQIKKIRVKNNIEIAFNERETLILDDTHISLGLKRDDIMKLMQYLSNEYIKSEGELFSIEISELMKDITAIKTQQVALSNKISKLEREIKLAIEINDYIIRSVQ